ncbi:heavy-metal-associated domain-containing protein [Agriterribacter sp.]|uniref:heavy-metal-associated domain-containing protein n=1 Tax=Agriterribacter sp. TaxID=2821509 RepID=UPI002D02E381|nr:heavy-metal-associated domain-containing protein [Agriterribacter sp.]HRO47502.1 heavy-metal-associated domain-containing protein [Agriterribacter sp.]HRQ18332.1 heavy-metal-associated domain-containing protein [Agriterribacter sp.]
MKTIQLKTNINCSGCVEKVTPSLNETFGETNWNVDTADPKKILTVTADNADETNVIKAVERAGYKAGKLD